MQTLQESPTSLGGEKFNGEYKRVAECAGKIKLNGVGKFITRQTECR